MSMTKPFAGETIILADQGFVCKERMPVTLKIGPKGTWNERVLVETVLSMPTGVCRLKHLFQRGRVYLRAHLAYLAALFNLILRLDRRLHPDAPNHERLLHLALYSL